MNDRLASLRSNEIEMRLIMLISLIFNKSIEINETIF